MTVSLVGELSNAGTINLGSENQLAGQFTTGRGISVTSTPRGWDIGRRSFSEATAGTDREEPRDLLDDGCEAETLVTCEQERDPYGSGNGHLIGDALGTLSSLASFLNEDFNSQTSLCGLEGL